MSIPKEHEKEFAQFPAVLRELVTAELAAGNTVAEFSHGFPAAPCGAYIILSREVTTRPRVKTPELDFYDRDRSSYSGEFTDAKRHFFVLEPAHPPKPPPDMDAIRAEMEARQLAADAERFPDMTERDYSSEPHLRVAAPSPSRMRPTAAERAVWSGLEQNSKSAVSRFRASMVIDYDKWHDGIGYDLDILKEATPDELKAIEAILIQRHSSDWRDVEALAAINSTGAKEALKTALRTGDAAVRMAVHSHAPELMTERQRTDSLVQALEQAEIYGGLTQALLEIEEFHPPEVIRTLLRGLMERDGGTACHFAAMLYFLHGKAKSAFDWDHRPFFLRFNTTDMEEREKAVRELCATIGADPSRCIKPKPAKTTLSAKKKTKSAKRSKN